MRIHVVRTRGHGDDSWTNRAVFSPPTSDTNAMETVRRFGLLLRAVVPGSFLEVAVDTFNTDRDYAFPIVNELGPNGEWKAEDAGTGGLIEHTKPDYEQWRAEP